MSGSNINLNNYVLKIQYDGGRYSGWQKQGNTGNTIQGKPEELLGRLLNEEIEVNGSGRTDAGVHAICQVANFKTSRTLIELQNEQTCLLPQV